MSTAVTYSRLSEVERGDTEGIERQQRELDAFAQRLGVDVVERLTDNDLSAAKKNLRRPAFEALMDGIASNRWDVVILRSLDRWVRLPAELEKIIEVVEHSKVTVETVAGGPVNLRTIEGRMNARMVTTFSIAEVERTRQRVTMWHEDRANRGLSLHSRPGFGYSKLDGRMIVDEAEAVLIRDAVRRVLEGETLAAIGREWGKKPQYVRQTLLSPRIAGLRVHNGKVVGIGQWEPIIDRFTFDRLRAMLNHPDRRTRSRGEAWLLTGLARCWKCRRTLNAAPAATRRYICKNCRAVKITADPLEQYVVAELLIRVDRPTLKVEREVDQDAIAVDILAVEARMEALAAEVAGGGMTMAEWKEARTVMVGQLDRLRALLAIPTRKEWQGRRGELEARWLDMPLAEQRTVLRGWIVTVEVGPATVGVNRFDPSRVEDRITWRD